MCYNTAENMGRVDFFYDTTRVSTIRPCIKISIRGRSSRNITQAHRQFIKDGVIAMYSLLPAMKNVSVSLLVRVIEEMEQHYSTDSFIRHLTRFKVILNRSTTLTESEKQEMNDALYSYDSLLESDPGIQEKVEKGKASGKTEGAQEMVTTLVGARFPQLLEVAQQKVSNIQSVEVLAQLIKQIGTVEDEKTALWVLNSYAA